VSEPLDRAFQQLRHEYLASMPARLDELRSDVAGFRAGAPQAAISLQNKLHRLAGSGGSYGFSELSKVAREAEHWLGAGPSPADSAELDAFIERIIAAAGHAEAELAPAAANAPTITPRALVIMRSSPERDRIAQELRGAGYEVRFGSRQDDPDTTPVEQLPHLIVIGGEAGDGDPSAVASAWTRSPNRRPGAVVLVETLRAVDRLRAVAAGVDAVFPAEQVEQKLPRYARTFARIGPPPSSVLLAEPDPSVASRIAAPLEEANIKVVSCPPGHTVTESLERESPDLLLLSAKLRDPDAFTVARMVRQDPRYHLLPIVFLGEEDSADRIEALRAGGDDFLSAGASPDLLRQTVIARATRGRRVREMVHRDSLTGLLNHATLLAELEHAVEYSRRHGEPLAFVLFELEGFRQITERRGTRIGDEVLLHIAAVFRSNVRASDVIGRYGWEAFGMLLRGASAGGAAALADKLHRILGEQPAQTSGGGSILLPVKVGTAVFPRDGLSASELALAADRRLRTAGKRGSGEAVK
jgi:diguanylate cyclase (GGDEF)-like protein